MDITVYLPDEIAARAKKQNVNLSRMLRDALVAQFEQEDIVAKTVDAADEVVLVLEDEHGHTYKGRFRATKIADSEDVQVFVTSEENVVVYESDQLKYRVCADPENDLRDWLQDGDYVLAMNALGLEATVDLDI